MELGNNNNTRSCTNFFFSEAQVNFSQYHQNAISDYQMHPKHIFLATGEKQMIWSLNFFFATSIYNPHKKNLHSAPKTKEKVRYLDAERTLIASLEKQIKCVFNICGAQKKNSLLLLPPFLDHCINWNSARECQKAVTLDTIGYNKTPGLTKKNNSRREQLRNI